MTMMAGTMFASSLSCSWWCLLCCAGCWVSLERSLVILNSNGRAQYPGGRQQCHHRLLQRQNSAITAASTPPMATPILTMTRLWILLAFAFLVGCHAGIPTPQVTVGLSSDSGLEPKVKWSGSESFGDFDVEGGIDATVNKDLPFTLWGKATRAVGDFDVSVRGAVRSTDPETVAFTVKGVGPTTTVQVDGTAGSKRDLGKIQFRKLLNDSILGGRLMVHPSYHVKNEKGSLSLTYALDNTAIAADLTKDDQQFAVSQNIGDKTRITPRITNKGRATLDVSRILNKELGVVTAGLGQETVQLQWQQGQTTVTAQQSWSRIHSLDGLTFKVLRKVDL